MIRSEIRDLERLGPLPTDDDDYPGIDQKLLDFELCLANIDPPITMSLSHQEDPRTGQDRRDGARRSEAV